MGASLVRRTIAACLACCALSLAAASAASAANSSNITVVPGTTLTRNSGAPNFTPTGSDSQVGADLIANQLEGGADVTLNTSPDFGEAGTITVSAAVSATGSHTLILNANSSVALNATVAVPNLTIAAPGGVTQMTAVTAAATVPGTSTLSANTTHDISLTNDMNDFGTVTTGGGQVADLNITDKNALVLNGVATNGLLVLTTKGAITQTGPVGPSSTVIIDAGAANDVTLNGPGNHFVALEIDSARNVSVTNPFNLTLTDVSISGDLSVSASGAIAQSGGTSVGVAGTATLNAGAGNNITLDHAANDFGTVGITSGNDVAIVDANDLALAGSTASGALSAAAGGDVTVPASTTVAATGAMSLVADNQNPTSPAIGTGGISVGTGSALTGAGAIKLYGARRGDNSIAANATFNGSTFTPGPLFVNGAREQWGVYSPAGTATAPFTFFYKDTDTTPPQVAITTPANGATYSQGQVVSASYACTDPGGSVASCTGPVPSGSPIDTSAPGQKTFTVQAVDGAGHTTSATATYTVAPTPTTAQATEDAKCAKLRKKLSRQRHGHARAAGSKRSMIARNIAGTNRRMRRLGC